MSVLYADFVSEDVSCQIDERYLPNRCDETLASFLETGNGEPVCVFVLESLADDAADNDCRFITFKIRTPSLAWVHTVTTKSCQ